jgi:hypothetical protein
VFFVEKKLGPKGEGRPFDDCVLKVFESWPVI